MARRKQEIALQTEIETQEEWEEMLAKEGLTVVDVYQEWCGPSKPFEPILRRLRNELGDSLLRFAVAKSDTIDALEGYRGKCEPCFLFFAGGVLVALVRGANSPVLTKTIMDQLSTEHKVLDGEVERKEIRDPLLGESDSKEKGIEDAEEQEKDDDEMVMDYNGERIMLTNPELADDEPQKKNVTVCIIKPDAVKEGKTEEILQKLRDLDIEILQEEERNLTEEEAREFYRHLEEEPFFDELIQFMISGPSHVLVLTKGETGENVVDEFRELLGPKSVEDAKEQAPDSLRAQYGTKEMMNAIHGSDSPDTAAKELAFFFPEFNVPIVPGTGPKPKIERTLAIVRPDALATHKDVILEKIKEAGFQIALMKEIQITKEQAEEFYKEHKEQPYFEELTGQMSSGPLLALGLAREQAITAWRDLLGPKEVPTAKEEKPDSEENQEQTETSDETPEDKPVDQPADQSTESEKLNLRAQFHIEGSSINSLHGSDSVEHANKELDFFFPMQQTMAVIKPDGYQTKDEIMEKIREAGFHIAARKETEITKDIAEQFYKNQSDKEFYGDLTDHMTSGKTLFMILTKEDAVDNWRQIIGPTDPEAAKTDAPDSLRALFGQDVKANAVHGSSNPDHAKEEIQQIFGDVEFNADGTVQGGPIGDEADEQEAADRNAEDADQQPAADGDQPPAEDDQDIADDFAYSEEEFDEDSGDQPKATTPADQQPVDETVAPSDPDAKDETEDQATTDKPDDADKNDKKADDDAATGDQQPAPTSPTGSAEEKAEVEDKEKKDAPPADDDAPKGEDQPVDDSQPADGDKPADDGDKPTADADKPADGDAAPADAAPANDGDKPADDADKPADDADKPADDADKPADDADKPADDSDKQTGDADKPADDSDKLADDAQKPADDADAKPNDSEDKPAD